MEISEKYSNSSLSFIIFFLENCYLNFRSQGSNLVAEYQTQYFVAIQVSLLPYQEAIKSYFFLKIQIYV